ncbi:MAG TPA: T9SS type A sorting domain-containing protein [Melioribacteraceae bacterium]|nr:T9SS type A sorting domain-containing protein [Melioribacteraceae bacterium]
MLKYLLSFFIIFNNVIFSQWQLEWTSSNLSNSYVSGWISFQQSDDTWIKRPYYIDVNKFYIFNDIYSSVPQYSYTFTQAEKDAGYLLYSFTVDLTGDGFTEFYVLSSYGTASPYRQGIKIIDIVNNKVLLELNETSSYYSSPTIWDVDNDGILECLISKFNYPSFSINNLISYNTGISTSIKEHQIEKIEFNLKQNYPNPFNPQTNIEFDLQNDSNVNLKIFDINGKEVNTLINDNLNSGTHKLIWSGTDKFNTKVASGVYFYQLNVNGFSNTKKMIYLK